MTDVYIGDDLTIFFPQAKDALGNVVDLTGASLFCDVQQTGTSTKIAASSTSIDIPATAGRCRALFAAAITFGFVSGKSYVYDGLVRLANGELHVVGKGSFNAKTRVTPQPA